MRRDSVHTYSLYFKELMKDIRTPSIGPRDGIQIFAGGVSLNSQYLQRLCCEERSHSLTVVRVSFSGSHSIRYFFLFTLILFLFLYFSFLISSFSQFRESITTPKHRGHPTLSTLQPAINMPRHPYAGGFRDDIRAQ